MAGIITEVTCHKQNGRMWFAGVCTKA